MSSGSVAMGFLNRVYRTSPPSVWHHQLNAQGFFEVGLNRISVQAVKGDIHPFFFGHMKIGLRRNDIDYFFGAGDLAG